MTAAVGDVTGKISLLRRDLFQIRYPRVFDEDDARYGHSQALLPVINFILSQFSRHVASLAASYSLAGRKGKRYIENVFKLARETFGMRIVLNSAQFLSEGYAERKLMFVHQLIVACREYHSTATRQERLGVLQQKQDGFLKKPPAVLKKQEKTTNIIPSQEAEDSPQSLSVHFKMSKIPEEPRCLPKNLLSAFHNQLEEAAEVENEGEDVSSLEEETPIALGTRNSYPSPCIESNVSNTFKAEIKTLSPVNCSPDDPVPSHWRQENDVGVDALQLAQDTKDISTRMRTLEQRLEETNKHLMNLETSSKAHIRVLEGRILALEQFGRQNENEWQMRSHPLRNNFLAPSPSQMNLTSINHFYNKKSSWNSPPTTCLNPLYAESTPATEVPPPKDQLLAKVPSRADGTKKHQNELKVPEFNAILDSQGDLQRNIVEKCTTSKPQGISNFKMTSGISNGGSSTFEEAKQQENSHSFNYSDTKQSVDSQDVLLSLRARLAEAQAVIEDARTMLKLSPPL